MEPAGGAVVFADFERLRRNAPAPVGGMGAARREGAAGGKVGQGWNNARDFR